MQNLMDTKAQYKKYEQIKTSWEQHKLETSIKQNHTTHKKHKI